VSPLTFPGALLAAGALHAAAAAGEQLTPSPSPAACVCEFLKSFPLLIPKETAAQGGTQVRSAADASERGDRRQVRDHSYLRSSVDPTLPSPLPCYGPLTPEVIGGSTVGNTTVGGTEIVRTRADIALNIGDRLEAEQVRICLLLTAFVLVLLVDTTAQHLRYLQL